MLNAFVYIFDSLNFNMIRSIFALTFFVFLFCSEEICAQNIKCQQNIFLPGTINPLKKRGLDSHVKKNFVAGKTKIMPSDNLKIKNKLTNACSVSFLNVSDQKTHIYIDSIYCGSIDAGGIGYIEFEKGYNDVYCITEDSKKSWVGKGGCDCKYVFHLN